MTSSRFSKIFSMFALICILLLGGCQRSFDADAYMSALLDAMYKGSYTTYADISGQTTVSVSSQRYVWLEAETDSLLRMFGDLNPSDEMRERLYHFLGSLYADASYTVEAGEDHTAVVTLAPMTLLQDRQEDLQNIMDKINRKNAEFAYSDLTDTEYDDLYLDMILTSLESRLSTMTYSDTVKIPVAFTKNEDGLYEADPEALTQIQKAMLVMPKMTEKTEEEKTEEEIIPETEVEE